MANYTRNYILVGLVWLVGGTIFGAWLGASGNFVYSNSHDHANLLGFVTSVLFGLLHWACPALGQSRIALPQLVIHEAGAGPWWPAKSSWMAEQRTFC